MATTWELKSESDTDRVFAEHVDGVPTGQHRYEFFNQAAPVSLLPAPTARRGWRTAVLITSSASVAAALTELAHHFIH